MQLPPEGWFARLCGYHGPPLRALLVRLYPEDTSDKRQELARYWVCYGCSFVRLHADWCCGKFTCHRQANGMYLIESKLNDCRIECMGWEILDREGWVEWVRTESFLTSLALPGLAPETLPSHPHWNDKTVAQRFDTLLNLLAGRRGMLNQEVEDMSLFEGLYATLWNLGRTTHSAFMIRIQPSPGSEQPSLFICSDWRFVSTPTSWVVRSMSYSESIVKLGDQPVTHGTLASSRTEFQIMNGFGVLSEMWCKGPHRSDSEEYRQAAVVLKNWTESMLNGYYL